MPNARAFRALQLCGLSALAFSLTACAGDRVSVSGPAMALGAPAAPPAAYLDYCVRAPGECGVDPARADAGQVVTRRYWKAVFAASDHRLRDGRIDWAGVASSIDEAPAATHADAAAGPDPAFGQGQAFAHGMSTDRFLNTYGGPELAAVAGHASALGSARPPAAPAVAPTIAHRVVWDAATRRQVAEINRKANKAIIERPDIVTYGVEDYWAIPTLQGADRYGDCEDYVLMKRRDLIASGVAPEALSIAIVMTREGGSHAVLLIATDRGDFVLDNLDPAIRNWAETSYRWVERQAPGSAFAWARAGAAVLPAPMPLGPAPQVALLAPKDSGPSTASPVVVAIETTAGPDLGAASRVAPPPVAPTAAGAVALRDTGLALQARFAILREP